MLFVEVSTGRLAASVETQPSWVGSLAFSPRGDLMASSGADATVRLWQVEIDR